MTTILIGLGEYAVSKTPGDSIKTLGLGSCVAVTVLHAHSGAIGMVHVVLPDSKADAKKAVERPGYFADTAISVLFDEMNKLTNSGGGRYIVKLVGGAAVLTGSPANENMNIGKRNVLATKKALWKRGVGALAEDVGGSESRSVRLDFGKVPVEITHGGRVLSTL